MVGARGDRPQPRGEVPQGGWFFDNLEAADRTLPRIHFENRFHHVIDVALRVNAAGDGQAQQFVAGVRRRTSPSRSRPTAHAGVPVEFDGQRLAGKLVPRDMRQHAAGVDIDGVAAGRLDDGHAVVGDVAAQVAAWTRCDSRR